MAPPAPAIRTLTMSSRRVVCVNEDGGRGGTVTVTVVTGLTRADTRRRSGGPVEYP